jgi:membrane fusion protein (multidrug efflux system)
MATNPTDEKDVIEEDELTPTSRRRLFLTIVLLVFIIAGAIYAYWWTTKGRYAESTDDAYVGANIVQITPQISGTVTAVNAEETEYVKAGQPLVELEKADGRVALDQAEAQLAVTVRQISNLIATTGEREAAVAQRRTDLARTREDLARREKIASSGAVSVEETEHARGAVAAAQAALDVAERALASHQTLVRGTSVESHPQVLTAAARVREAYLNYARTAIPSPVSGVVAKKNVQVGQRVAPGAALLTVAALDNVWVDANFKEVQLAALRVGQPVTLHADLYGSDVEYHGKVNGFAAGTGAAFALLPAQNATGNWIKIVQRVPVRVTLDAAEVAKNPLQVGLSMHVEVDTHNRDGDRLPRVGREAAPAAAATASPLDALAAQRVSAIIAANR